MRTLILLFGLMVAFASCKHDNHQHHKGHEMSKSDSPLYKEVMEVHDAIMPEISTIHKLKNELKSIETPENKDIILDQIQELDKADESMMSWMAAFKVPEDKTMEEQYLTEQKGKIQYVSDYMKSSMSNATMLIDSLKALKAE